MVAFLIIIVGVFIFNLKTPRVAEAKPSQKVKPLRRWFYRRKQAVKQKESSPLINAEDNNVDTQNHSEARKSKESSLSYGSDSPDGSKILNRLSNTSETVNDKK